MRTGHKRANSASVYAGYMANLRSLSDGECSCTTANDSPVEAITRSVSISALNVTADHSANSCDQLV